MLIVPGLIQFLGMLVHSVVMMDCVRFAPLSLLGGFSASTMFITVHQRVLPH